MSVNGAGLVCGALSGRRWRVRTTLRSRTSNPLSQIGPRCRQAVVGLPVVAPVRGRRGEGGPVRRARANPDRRPATDAYRRNSGGMYSRVSPEAAARLDTIQI